MYQYVLFDLDGTLTDPKEGITKSAQYALKSFGIDEPDSDKLEPFIGPPLGDSFRDFYGFDDEKCQQAIKTFREYFESTGIRENKIYPGMADMLKSLKEQGVTLVVASSKPQESVHIVLKLFDIEQYFDLIVGSLKDGSRVTKIEVMEEAFSQLKAREKRKGRKLDLSQVLMVGDRKFDIEGARHFGVDSVAVTYGYAPDGELEEAEPTWFADSVSELEEVICQKPSYMKYSGRASFSKTLQVLYPIALYWAWELIVFNVLYILFASIWGISDEMKNPVSVYLNALTAVSTWPLLIWLYRQSCEPVTSHVISRRYRNRLMVGVGMIGSYAIGLAMGLNLMVTFFRLASYSASYEEVASTQYSVPLGIGLIVYGILTPITEELIFRGVLYNRIRKYFPVPVAIFLGALVFGCYHGNLVQMVYAFLMGLAINMMYEYYKHLGAPIIFHCCANFVVYLFAKTFGEIFTNGAMLYGACFLVFAMGVTCIYLAKWKKSRQKYFR